MWMIQSRLPPSQAGLGGGGGCDASCGVVGRWPAIGSPSACPPPVPEVLLVPGRAAPAAPPVPTVPLVPAAPGIPSVAAPDRPPLLAVDGTAPVAWGGLPVALLALPGACACCPDWPGTAGKGDAIA